MRKTAYLLTIGVLLTIIYLLLWPVPIDPRGWTPPPMPAAEGVYAENDLLTETDIIASEYVGGESIAIDTNGLLYTGLADGRIIRMDQDGENIEVFAIAIDPLGMDFGPEGNLFVADATQGLLSINKDGKVNVLVPAGDEEAFFYLNDLAVASDGKVYFSQASTKFKKMEYVYEIAERGPYGSLWLYDPTTDATEKLIGDICYANGVALSPREDFVLVSEIASYRLLRYWLAGSRKGQSDVFIDNLPGFPDNITSNDSDTFWLALGGGPISRTTIDGLHPYPFLTKLVFRIPKGLQPAPTLQGYIIGLDLEGNVIHTLQDLTGSVFAPTTSAIEFEGELYLGSLSMSGIGRISVPATPL